MNKASAAILVGTALLIGVAYAQTPLPQTPNPHSPNAPALAPRVPPSQAPTPRTPTTQTPTPQAPVPQVMTPHALAEKRNVDALLEALKAAPDSDIAARLEARLLHAWLRSGSPAVTLLLSQGTRLLRAGEPENALQSFSDAITLQPDMAEAWHQRAVARLHIGDASGAIRDIQETVRLEPRNFAAFRTLAEVAAARKDWKGAYAAWQKAMELDPKMPGGEERLQELRRHALGEDT